MTAQRLPNPRAGTRNGPTSHLAAPGRINRRVVSLHLASRRTVPALAIVAACAAALRVVPHIQWLSSKGLQAQLVPLIIEAGAGMAIATSTRSPIGEPERTAGPLLPILRLTVSILSTAAAVGLLLLGATGTTLAGGNLDVVRNLTGLVGIGLLSATTLGGSFAWVGPMAYMVTAEQAINGAWSTPWAWPARPPHDHGAALCAGLVFVVAIAAITLFGARDSKRD